MKIKKVKRKVIRKLGEEVKRKLIRHLGEEVKSKLIRHLGEEVKRKLIRHLGEEVKTYWSALIKLFSLIPTLPIIVNISCSLSLLK